MNKFKIGDKIFVNKEFIEGSQIFYKGEEGIVREGGEYRIAIEWVRKLEYGHDCGLKCKIFHGYYINNKNINNISISVGIKYLFYHD